MRNLLVGAVLAGAALSASAQPLEPRGYIGANYGVSRYDIDGCGSTAGFSCDETGKAWRVHAGYQFLPWLAIEGAYLNFGEAELPGVLRNPPVGTTSLPTLSDLRTNAYVLSLVGRVPIGPAALFAKVGYGAVTAKFSGNSRVQNNMTGAITFLNSEARESEGKFVYGLGASFNFANAWQARFDWDRTNAKDNINPEYDVSMYTLGIGYRF